MLSRLFNITLPFFCSAIRPGFTAVTVVKFQDEEGELVAPEFEILNDVRHVMHIDAELVFNN